MRLVLTVVAVLLARSPALALRGVIAGPTLTVTHSASLTLSHWTNNGRTARYIP